MAQAVSVATPSSFIAQLLAPIVAPAGVKAARQFDREQRRELEDAWALARHRYYAADAYRSYCTHRRRAAEIEQRRLLVPEAIADEQAQLDFVAAIDAMMLVPAPTIGALRVKQKLRKVSGGRDRWEAAIADDVAQLEGAA